MKKIFIISMLLILLFCFLSNVSANEIGENNTTIQNHTTNTTIQNNTIHDENNTTNNQTFGFTGIHNQKNTTNNQTLGFTGLHNQKNTTDTQENTSEYEIIEPEEDIQPTYPKPSHATIEPEDTGIDILIPVQKGYYNLTINIDTSLEIPVQYEANYTTNNGEKRNISWINKILEIITILIAGYIIRKHKKKN